MAEDAARIVFFARPEDPADLREILQSALGVNKVDAATAAGHAPGITRQSWPHAMAKRAAGAAAQAGVKAVAVREASIPDLSQAETVTHVRCMAWGFEICDRSGDVDRIWDWSDLRLISAGRVPLEVQRHYVTDTLGHAGTPVPPDPYLEGEPLQGYEAWLLFESPLRIVRFDSEHMNYESLGKRKSGSGTANFERMIADLAGHAPHAYLTPATRKYLTRGPLLEYDFADSAALQEYTQMQYCLSQQMHAADL